MKVYMHTMDGKPAFFHDLSGQIVYLHGDRRRNVLRTSLEQIRRDQDVTRAFRSTLQCGEDGTRYGYIMFYIDDDTLKGPTHDR